MRGTRLLFIQDLTKRFNGQPVIDGFDLTVPANGFTVLIGPSGCGKSTLFDLLMGIVPMDRGRLAWQGEDAPDLRSLAAYMQQRDLLLPWLSLQKNAALPAELAGMAPDRLRAMIRELFRILKLEGFESYLPAAVSGGMRQRCALARTLMFARDLVLLDEPLSALDAITRRQLQAYLLLLQTEFNKSILMVTHDVEEALLLADDLLVLTAPPMRICERFKLTAPKPRDMAQPAFLEIKAQVLARLEKEAGL
jgi:ABC-type nitrate/sulfonate/bicarbonate transport system ATPase subunit